MCSGGREACGHTLKEETKGSGRDGIRQTTQFSKVDPRSQEGQVLRYS